MKKSSCLLVAAAVIAVSFATVSYLPANVKAATLYVGGAGPGNYTTIQAAIDDANPGDIVYVYNGTYRELVRVNKTLTFVGEDKNTTIVEGYGILDVFYVEADWVNITGFTFRNSGITHYDAGVKLSLAQNCTIYDNRFTNNQYGVLALYSSNTTVSENIILDNHWGIDYTSSDDSKITNNTFVNNDIGAYLSDAASPIIAGNDFSLNNDDGISLGASTKASITANTFVSNGIHIRGGSLSHFNSHTIPIDNEVNGKPIRYYKDCDGLNVDGTSLGQLLVGNCTNVSISNLQINETDVGVEFGFVEGATIDSNTISDTDDGIFLLYSSNVAITRNGIWNPGTGINPWFSTNITMANNTISVNSVNPYGSGIHPFRSSDILIIHNSMSRLGENIYIQNSENVSVSNNGLLSEYEGVRLWVSTNITINKNNISGNGTGIRSFYSNNITIRGNDFLSNDYGIRIQGECHGNSDVTVTGNTIVSSGIGIDLNNAIRVLVHHNNLINNTLQAYDGMGPENSWDNGYPSGGNYWSDYAGVDNCSGSDQDICPDPDGIGDTPYVIDANSTDRYPLMSPIVLAPARPPTGLKATLAGGSSENVHLVWSLSPDDGMRLKSVVGYYVYRNTSYNREGWGYPPVAYLPNGTSEFMDISAGEGNPNNYFYRVCAVDVNNNTTCSMNQAGKFTRALSTGPNLVSVPLIQSNESIETVLQTVKYDKAWFYDSSSQEWKWFMKSKGYRRGLWNINHTMGLWGNVTENSNLTVAGIVPAQTTILLHKGWNLVAFPSFNTSYAVADLKMETGATRVEGYDPSLPPYYLGVLGDTEVLRAGYGYWVRVDIDVDWIVEAS